MKLIELNYYCHNDIKDPAAVAEKHAPSNLFYKKMVEKSNVLLVKHMAVRNEMNAGSIRYRFFTRRNSFWQIPFRTHRFLSREKPDIVLVQGLIFPLQVMALRLMIGTGPTIILQHQAEIPFRRKRIFQKLADRFVQGYLFTSSRIADEWIHNGIIASKNKCFDALPATTTFTNLLQRQPQAAPVFLWVGRLNANKDPLTVLEAFRLYFTDHPGVLYMIYQEADLEAEVKHFSKQNNLEDRIILVGKIPHAELEAWYNKADYFISGSHHEGGSFALIEAMACGCIPIVTDIPASMKMIGEGEAGYYFSAGNETGLLEVLCKLKIEHRGIESKKVTAYFEKHLSSTAMADNFWKIVHQLTGK